MSWTDIFRSRYVRFLEAELANVRKKHAEETEQLNSSNALERERCINEANRGWAEADRLRQYLIPGLATSTRTTETALDNKTDKEEVPTESGTPWMRQRNRMMLEDQKQFKAREAERKAKELEKAKAEPVAVPAGEKS